MNIEPKTFHVITCCEILGYSSIIKIECFEKLCRIFLGNVMYPSSISTTYLNSLSFSLSMWKLGKLINNSHEVVVVIK